MTEAREVLDIEDILSELERVIRNAARLAAEGGGRADQVRRYGPRGEVKVRTSVKVSFLDEMLQAEASRPRAEQEPMIDAMRTKEGLKVLVHLPGVRKEDIRIFPRQSSLVFEINTRGRSLRKEIPCDLRPSEISIKSMVENNSVVEIMFARKGEVVRR